jgi:hypothetical protein
VPIYYRGQQGENTDIAQKMMKRVGIINNSKPEIQMSKPGDGAVTQMLPDGPV